ncbi:hypothetical protein V6N12_049974 [Hibiscus sabdariffa]|uniref:Uncharacterized protein n=1 Tax=Hibiscus sabdariffa TaxID=183260 RepID=A0ABR2GC04_9ROSI
MEKKPSDEKGMVGGVLFCFSLKACRISAGPSLLPPALTEYNRMGKAFNSPTSKNIESGWAFKRTIVAALKLIFFNLLHERDKPPVKRKNQNNVASEASSRSNSLQRDGA